MKRLIWFLPVLLMIITSGCLKDDSNEGTILLMGTESEVLDVDRVVPDTLRKFLADNSAMNMHSVVLPTGNVPPDIQGQYVLTPTALFAYNNHHPLADDSLFFRFYDQNNRLVSCDIYEKSYSLKSISDAYLMGAGYDFAVYFTATYECKPIEGEDFIYTLTRGYLITGQVTSTGIDKAIVACINISVEYDTSAPSTWTSIIQDAENDIFVYCVLTGTPFGSAVRYQWLSL